MGDDPQMTGPNASLASAVTGFLGTVWGKVVAILAAISLIMGIALEVQSFVRGIYDVETANAQAQKARAEAAVAPEVAKGEEAKARALHQPAFDIGDGTNARREVPA